jgi:hypothetical protein
MNVIKYFFVCLFKVLYMRAQLFIIKRQTLAILRDNRELAFKCARIQQALDEGKRVHGD